MNKQEAIDLIAEHFTGSLVAHHSIGLQAGGVLGKMSKEFFDVREQLGIVGYATKDQAAAILRAALDASGEKK